MKEEDLQFIEAQLARLDVGAPPPPAARSLAEELFADLVRTETLWTPQEYAYIQHFHQVYGFDDRSTWLRGKAAYDEWMYWHLTAVERYRMGAADLARHLASLPAIRPLVWHFSVSSEAARSKGRTKKWRVCMPWDNEVPYDVPSMQARGWQFIVLRLTIGIIWKLDAPFPHSIFALTQDDPAVTVLFDGADAFGELTYYLDNKETINKKYKVRAIESPLDHTIYVPDAGYSYRWEDGSLLPDGYIARLEADRAERRAEQQPQKESEENE